MLKCVLSLLSALTATSLSTAAAAQPQFTVFGDGCRHGTTLCLTKNDGLPTAPASVVSTQWLFVRVLNTSTQPLAVNGFQLRLRRTSGDPRTPVAAALFLSNGSRPANMIRTTSSIFVEASMEWCPSWFPTQTLAPNEAIFVGVQCAGASMQIDATNSTAGSNNIWFTDTIQQPSIALKWRLECGGGSPNMREEPIGNLPRIGTTFGLHCDNVPQVGSLPSVAILVVGSSSSMWRGLPIPFHLGSSGAPQCELRVSDEFGAIQVPVFNRTATFNFQVPNLPGTVLYCQWFVGIHQSNSAGFSTSEAARMQF